jgi:hypothetical protein
VTNNGDHTLVAPAMDGCTQLLYTNGPSAGTITFTGFAAGYDTKELNTIYGNKFMIEIMRLAGVSTYRVKALQDPDPRYEDKIVPKVLWRPEPPGPTES